MRTATVRDLRNRYSQLLAWLAAGEEILITRRGKSIARLTPEPPSKKPVDWSHSTAVNRDRSGERILNAQESAQIIAEAAGKW